MKFEEIKIGTEYTSGTYSITKEKIIQYAKEYDPQYLHLDEEKAKESRFKGIIASGIHTFSITMKLWIECDVFGEDIIAGVGMDHIRYLKPVYPDDELYVIAKVINKIEKTDEAGIIVLLLTTYNQKGKEVLELEASALIKATVIHQK